MFLLSYRVCNKRDLDGVPGVFIHWLFAAHEGFEAADLFAGTEDDEGIAGVDLVLGRGGSVEPALRGTDGEDHRACTRRWS